MGVDELVARTEQRNEWLGTLEVQARDERTLLEARATLARVTARLHEEPAVYRAERRAMTPNHLLRAWEVERLVWERIGVLLDESWQDALAHRIEPLADRLEELLALEVEILRLPTPAVFLARVDAIARHLRR